MKTIRLLLSLFMLLSCGREATKPQFKVVESAFSKSLNTMPMPTDVDLTQVKKLVNNDYPIEVALFKDNQWFYNLPNLGSGKGTYHYKDGVLKLFASRDLFDIYMEVRAADEQGSAFRLSFSDRFSYKLLETEINN